MLNRLDHIVLLTRDFDTARKDYQTLFGFGPKPVVNHHGFQTALFQSGNTGLEIMAPESEAAQSRTNEILGDKSSKLTSLAFGAQDMSETHRVLNRRGAEAGVISSSFRLSDEVCAGIKTFVVPDNDAAQDRDISLDHLVINTPNPDRAIAHYGARLGIRFALDRANEDWGARFMFFKLDDIVLEVIHRLGKNHDPSANDEIWGITWKVDDLEAHHERLQKAGVGVSEMRTGRKPGTRVFTVKSHSDGVPTLFLAAEG